MLDTAELLDALPTGQLPAPVDVARAIWLAAACMSPSGRQGRELAEDTMRVLARHLCIAPDRDPATELQLWAQRLNCSEMATEMRSFARSLPQRDRARAQIDTEEL
ncbi:hypothetical protein [Nonomuraea dietziae]|uniref:hypothetical protein n=1 Tax=Nonomuraea dietziae TaxID=65515 RepID=UPI00341BC095